MNMNSESELLAALLSLTPVVEETIEYRVYYNDQGQITQCSMRNHPAEGDYLIVQPDEYDNYFRYTVVDGKLKKIDLAHSFHVKLIKTNSGHKVAKNHAGVIIEPEELYDNVEYYDNRIN